jgi:hypothetical protein
MLEVKAIEVNAATKINESECLIKIIKEIVLKRI